MTSFQPWTPSDDATLVTRNLNKESLSSIANDLQRTENAVAMRLRNLAANLVTRQGMSEAEACTSIGLADFTELQKHMQNKLAERKKPRKRKKVPVVSNRDVTISEVLQTLDSVREKLLRLRNGHPHTEHDAVTAPPTSPQPEPVPVPREESSS